MKYKPRYSNFDELQEEIAERLLAATENIETAKDAIAKEIDEYVDAILKERVEQIDVSASMGNKESVIDIEFSAGEKVSEQGYVDLFCRRVSLMQLLSDFRWWDELSELEPQSVRELADYLKRFAERLSGVAEQTEKQNEEWEKRWKEQEKGDFL